jgi:DNA-binding CsgD family transcriptional regulator
MHIESVVAPEYVRPLDSTEAEACVRALQAGRLTAVHHQEIGGRLWLVAVDEAPARLTAREMQAVALAARGMSNKVIAAELGVALSTAAGHIATAMRKMEARSRVELVARWNAAFPCPVAQIAQRDSRNADE